MNLSIAKVSTHRSYCDKDGVWHSTGIVGGTAGNLGNAATLGDLKQQQGRDDNLYEDFDVDEMKIIKAETKADRAHKKSFQSNSNNTKTAARDSKDKRRDKRKASRFAKYMANHRAEAKTKDKAQHSRRMERMSVRVVNME